MPFQIIRNDITKVAADAIVNTSNPRPVIGGGTDSAIYRAAGEEQLLAERKKIGNIAPGNAVSTPAFGLNAKYIIHTVGPAWIDGSHGEREILHSCYAKSLELAAGLSCESIAFPMIATGVYGFPKDEALDIALKEIGKFLLTHEMDITLVVFDRKALQLSEKLVGEIDKYIDEHAVGILRKEEYGSHHSSNLQRRRRMEEETRVLRDFPEMAEEPCFSKESRTMEDPVLYDAAPMPRSASKKAPAAALTGKVGKSLEDFLRRREDTFQQRLFKLIDERHLKDPDVYKKANIDRKAFSKIRCNKDYHPNKNTAIALAIALQLDMPDTQDLLSRAGYALSPGSMFDLIISYCVSNQKFDINEINAVLFAYDQPLLLKC